MSPLNLPTVNQRREIREEIARLLLFKTPAGERVSPNRTVPVSDQDLPTIAIYTLNEPVKVFNQSPLIYDRELAVVIEIHTGGEAWDDEGDEIAKTIETTMQENADTSAIWEELLLNETVQNDEEDGRIPIGATRLIYHISYRTEPAYMDPDPLPASPDPLINT